MFIVYVSLINPFLAHHTEFVVVTKRNRILIGKFISCRGIKNAKPIETNVKPHSHVSTTPSVLFCLKMGSMQTYGAVYRQR